MADDFEVQEVNPPESTPAPSKAPVPKVPGSKDDGANEPESKPYVMPRMAALSIIPKRTATIIGPEPYEKVSITLWINPPDGEVNARAQSSKNLGEYMAHFITDWSLVDEEGTKLPITEEGMAVFPKELWDWMIQQFGEARMRPLVPPKDDTIGKNRTPTPLNSSRNPSLNGTTS